MTDLSAFPITQAYPPAHPDRLQYYGLPTPNGVKVSIMLEECGLPYEAHRIDFATQAQKSPEFLSLNPNGKIPAVLDPDGPDGQPIGLWESGAILAYLADKTGRFLPSDAARHEVLAWLWWQVGGLGPMAGQLNFFAAMGGKDWEDKRPRDRFADEVRRLLGVMEARLGDGRDWLAGDYSIADIACIGWVRAARRVDGDGGLLGFGAFARVAAWLDRALARPAVRTGLAVLG
ncbi:glutathione S-transferase family protein [Sphingomonas bacterium]|uniref:glutathione S-transferase family protein n=1 Tax=Sphingomonas bacterium TaxID=1895847 RepID=UPI001577085A|nr:glutathione S-transferase N-terminal domain-containing protein [Sphingomonas bacterium]